MHRLSSLAAALLAVTAVLPTAAAIAGTRHVSYADLDLATSAGRAVIDARISAAASQLCLRDNRDLAQAAACRRESVAQARADLDRRIAANAVQVAAR